MLYNKVEEEVYIGAAETLPPFMVNMPLMVGTVVKVSVPVFIVKLLKVTAVAPFTVAAPAKFTVPVPAVNVPALVRVPDAAIAKVPPAVQASVPLLVTVVAVIALAALFKVRLAPLLIVMLAGAPDTEALIPTVLFTVVIAPAGGTEPPSQVEPVDQSVLTVVMYPKLVKPLNVPGPAAVVTLTVPAKLPFGTTKVIAVDVLLAMVTEVPPTVNAVALPRLVPVIVIVWPT